MEGAPGPYARLMKNELIVLCAARNLPTEGTKEILAAHLEAADVTAHKGAESLECPADEKAPTKQDWGAAAIVASARALAASIIASADALAGAKVKEAQTRAEAIEAAAREKAARIIVAAQKVALAPAVVPAVVPASAAAPASAEPPDENGPAPTTGYAACFTRQNLVDQCKNRGLKGYSTRRTKQELAEMLEESDAALAAQNYRTAPVTVLRTMCLARGLSGEGLKPELLSRLVRAGKSA